jgi:hypothetical protein
MHKHAKKVKIFVLAPALPDWNEIEHIHKSLNFLEKDYEIDFFNPLSLMKEKLLTPEELQLSWETKLKNLIESYDIFLGFSLGGIIIQNCLPFFTNKEKKTHIYFYPKFC